MNKRDQLLMHAMDAFQFVDLTECSLIVRDLRMQYPNFLPANILVRLIHRAHPNLLDAYPDRFELNAALTAGAIEDWPIPQVSPKDIDEAHGLFVGFKCFHFTDFVTIMAIFLDGYLNYLLHLPFRFYEKSFHAAVDAGISSAAAVLGACYMDGYDGVTVDIPESIRLLRIAAKLGNAAAQYRYGSYLRDSLYCTPKSRKWFQIAADQGCIESQVMIGFIYSHGEGVTKNLDMAIEWYTKAANQGSHLAEYNLGMLSENAGKCEESLKWFIKSAIGGNEYGQYEFGLLLYAKGLISEAIDWWVKSAENGYIIANTVLCICNDNNSILKIKSGNVVKYPINDD